ncbi:MAG: hypothetical protein NE328_21075 [Lentisphaeraceae bacterium]|nr:hypothetical protein [Lentisphaeraceae bacterium]
MNQPRWKTQIFYTTSAPVKAEPGPSYLQNHGNPAFYKNKYNFNGRLV